MITVHSRARRPSGRGGREDSEGYQRHQYHGQGGRRHGKANVGLQVLCDPMQDASSGDEGMKAGKLRQRFQRLAVRLGMCAHSVSYPRLQSCAHVGAAAGGKATERGV